MHYLLFYDVADDYLERRAPIRGIHLKLVRETYERGDLVLAGAMTEPDDGALLVFRSPDAAEAFAKADPYVANGVITGWRVRKWNTVVGDGATMPSIP